MDASIHVENAQTHKSGFRSNRSLAEAEGIYLGQPKPTHSLKALPIHSKLKEGTRKNDEAVHSTLFTTTACNAGLANGPLTETSARP